MFQYEIHNLKSGKVVYRHIFVDKDYQITITRAAITREQLRTVLGLAKLGILKTKRSNYY